MVSNNIVPIIDNQPLFSAGSLKHCVHAWAEIKSDPIILDAAITITLSLMFCLVPKLIRLNPISLLKCHCYEKIFDPILNTTEQHFRTSLNGVFSFSISCFVLEIY